MNKFFFAICVVCLTSFGCSSPSAGPDTPTQGAVNEVQGSTAPQDPTPRPPTETPAVVQPSNDECGHPYYPVVDGGVWIFRGSQGEFTHILSTGENGAFTIIVEGEDSTFTIEGQCTPEGISLVDAPGDSLTYEGESGSSSMSTTAIEGVTLPITMKVGDRWSQTLDVSVSSDGDPIRYTITMDYSIPGSEVVTVPAGTFETLIIEQRSGTDGSSTVFQTLWYAQGVGAVKSDIEGVGVSELVSYTFP